MMVKGEVKCLHCGYVSGTWVGASGSPLTMSGFAAPGGLPEGADANAGIHCLRCKGPVFLYDSGPVLSSERLRRIRRLRAQLAAYETPDDGFAA